MEFLKLVFGNSKIDEPGPWLFYSGHIYLDLLSSPWTLTFFGEGLILKGTFILRGVAKAGYRRFGPKRLPSLVGL
jgi:hypothetical protein